jgi:hypothetical protein
MWPAGHAGPEVLTHQVQLEVSDINQFACLGGGQGRPYLQFRVVTHSL